jgi:hypothetical protein
VIWVFSGPVRMIVQIKLVYVKYNMWTRSAIVRFIQRKLPSTIGNNAVYLDEAG